MRTLFEIIEGAKDGNKPTHDECYYAMLAIDSLFHFDHMDIRKLNEVALESKASLAGRAQMYAQESFRRSKMAHAKSPLEWLGSHVPEDAEYQRMRAMAFKIAEKATGIDLRAGSSSK